MVAELVHAVEFQHERTLQVGLRDLQKLCTLQFLAQKHAQHRRLLRVFHRNRRQIDARTVCTGGNEQLICDAEAAKCEDQLIAVRLKHAVYARAEQGRTDFLF